MVYGIAHHTKEHHMDALVFPGLLFLCLVYFYRQKLWVFLSALYRALSTRVKKVEKERHCVLCGAPPLYMLHLIEIDPFRASSSGLGGMQLRVCREHHPNAAIAPKADELHAYIRRMDPNLTFDRVYPYIFF